MRLLLRSIVRRSTVNFLPYWETCSSERCSPGLSTASLAGIAGERRECSHAGTTDFALRGFDGRHERVVLESGVLVRCRWLRRAHRGSQPHSPGAALCCDATGISIDHKGNIDEAGPGRDGGEIG